MDYVPNILTNYDLFELYCLIAIKYKSIYCMEELALISFKKKIYVRAFICYISLLIYTESKNHNQIDKCKEGIYNIISEIGKDTVKSNNIYNELLESIKIMNSEIPSYHMYTVLEIVNSIKDRLR